MASREGIEPFKGLVDCGPPPNPALLRDVTVAYKMKKKPDTSYIKAQGPSSVAPLQQTKIVRPCDP
jgi:hypothetical protein